MCVFKVQAPKVSHTFGAFLWLSAQYYIRAYFVFLYKAHNMAAAATIDKELNKHTGLLNAEQKRSLLDFIKAILPGDRNNVTTLEQYNKELGEAEAEIERGEYHTHEQAKEFLKERKSVRK